MDDIVLERLGKPRAISAPVVVKCRFHRSTKRITFAASALSLSLLRHKIDQSFLISGSAYHIRYRDDENEVTDIASDADLWEALEYFSEGTGDSSSIASAVSFASDGTRSIVMPLFVELEYEGPSLSETMSFRSSVRFGSVTSFYAKSDADESSYHEEANLLHTSPSRRFAFTALAEVCSLACGVVAAIQAPMLYIILLQFQAQQSFTFRAIHTFFTLSVLFYIFGAVLASITLLNGHGKDQTAVDIPLPNVTAHRHQMSMSTLWSVIRARAAHMAAKSSTIFTILGTISLLLAIMCLTWIAHPLALHPTMSRAILTGCLWLFLGCLAYQCTRLGT